MSLLADVEKSMRFWAASAVADIKSSDRYNQRDKSLSRAADLATIALALRAAQESSRHDA